MQNPNNCEKCAQFDEATKAILAQSFSQDEISLLVLLLSASIRFQSVQGAKLREAHDVRALQCQRDVDFAASITAKLLVGLDEKLRTELLRRIKKDQGVVLSLKHEKCPHHLTPIPVPDATAPIYQAADWEEEHA